MANINYIKANLKAGGTVSGVNVLVGAIVSASGAMDDLTVADGATLNLFSYAGFGTARLYFSEDRLETNAKGKKLLNDQCCSIRLNPAELKRSGEILDLCRKYTRIYPFLCTEEGMLVGKLADRIEKPILTAEDEIRTQGKD